MWRASWQFFLTSQINCADYKGNHRECCGTPHDSFFASKRKKSFSIYTCKEGEWISAHSKRRRKNVIGKKNVQAERKSSRIKINVDAPFARCSMISESHLLAQAHIEAMKKCDEKNKIGISTQLRRAWETIEPIFKAILMSSTSSRGARKQPEQNTTFCAIRHKTALFPRFCFTFFLRYLLQLFSFFSLVSLFLRW